MNRKAARCFIIMVAVLALAAPCWVKADDSAASIAAGGLVPRRETRIVMAKEVLGISPNKVVVDYDFRNDSDEDVTSEVAFPIPPYKNEFPSGSASEQSFQSFKLWVDGKSAHYESEAKATLKDRDVTRILNENHIDIPTFGHFDDSSSSGAILVPDFSRLPKAAQTRLLKDGLFEDQGSMIFSLYTVHLQYHWPQTFPAHSNLHVRHEYSPVVGFSYITVDALQTALVPAIAKKNADSWKESGAKDISAFCLEPELLRGLIRRFNESTNPQGSGVFYPHWVDFVLTTANTWKRPIEDFTLIVERPQSEHGKSTLMSLCSPGKVEKLDADHFHVHLTNFVPTAELHIGFFDVPVAKAAQPAARK